MNEQIKNQKVTIAGILIGIGMGGFVDGIYLHQIFQWHNMLSNKIPPVTTEAMRINMLWDGIFHAVVWFVTAIGIIILWSAAKEQKILLSNRYFVGLLLLGWVLFNLVEGIIDHHLLQLHNVKEVATPQLWNFGFLAIGGVGLIVLGWLLMRLEKQEVA